MMLTHMLLHNLTPHTACNMQNGAAVNVARSTLRRWWKHFEWWGETPVATACRFNYKPMVGSKAMTALEKVALDHIAAAHPAYYLDEMQDALERECGRRIHVSTLHRVLVSPRDQGGLGYSLKVLTVLAVQADQYERAIYRACLENVNDPAQFIFVDECSVGRNASRRRRGYERRGRPVSGF